MCPAGPERDWSHLPRTDLLALLAIYERLDAAGVELKDGRLRPEQLKHLTPKERALVLRINRQATRTQAETL